MTNSALYKRWLVGVTLEIVSDTFRPRGVMDGGKNDDPRTLGVQVRAIKLVRDETEKK